MKPISLLLFLSVLLSSFLKAEALFWDGSANDNWRNDSNWQNSTVSGPDRAPNPGDSATFSNAYAGNKNEVDLENSSGDHVTREIEDMSIRKSPSVSGGSSWTFNNGFLKITDRLDWGFNGSTSNTNLGLFAQISIPSGLTTQIGDLDHNPSTLNFSGSFHGSGTILKDGSAHTLNLQAASPAFTGTYRNGEGPTKISHNDALANATVDQSGGSFNFNTDDPSFAMLTGTNGLSIASTKTLTIGATNLSNTYSGGLGGSGTVVKTGTGTWTLDGSSSLSGTIICDQGTLALDHATVLKNAIVTPVGSGAIIALQDAKIGTLSGTHGTFDLGAHTVTLDKQVAGDLTYAGLIEGSGTLVYDPSTAAATLTLNPDLSSTFSGTIETHSGTLLNTSSALSQSTIKVVGDNSFSTPTFSIVGGLAGSGDMDLPGSLYFGANDASTSYSGNISRSSGSAALRKQGSGTWQFDGTTSGNWDFTLEEGTLTGNATFDGTFTSDSGTTLSPGASPGTTAVTGDTALAGTYLCEIDGSNNDLLEVGGNLDISAATLDVDVLGGGTTESAYVIATYGSLTGTFSSVVDLPAGYLLDYDYNVGGSTNNIALVVDTPPNATSVTASGSPLGEFSVTFDKPVVNFDAFSDLVVSTSSGNASASGATITGSGTSYTVQLTGLSGDGSLTLAVNTGSDVQDESGNPLASSATSSAISFDLVAPTVLTIAPSTTGPTNGSGLSFEVTFSEAVQNVDALDDLQFSGDITVGAAGFSNTGAVYTISVSSLTGDGTLALAIQTSSGITDLDGNPLASSVTSYAVTIDADPPTVANVTPVTSSPTNAGTFEYQLTFSEPVQNFDAAADLDVSSTGDAAFSGATVTDTGDATTFTIQLLSVTGTDGDLELTAATGTGVQDLLGNDLAASVASGTITLDKQEPQVTSIVPATTGPTGASSLDFDIYFDEAITGLDTFSDLNLVTTGTANATGATFTGSGDSYTVTLTGVSGIGTLSLELALPSDITDTIGNSLTATVTSAPVTLDADQELLWLLEEGTGTTTTESISGETTVATLNGPVSWTSAVSPNSAHGIAVDNDSPTPSYIDAGTKKTDDSYVAGSDPGYKVLTNNWTITGWINLNATQNQTGDRIIISSDWDSSNGWTFYVRDHTIQENLGFDFGAGRTDSGISIPTDQPVFVAILADNSATVFGGGTNKHRFAVWDGSSWQYSDGTEISPIRLQGLELGSFNDGQRQFEGALDEFRIYSKTLDQVELDQLITDTSPPTVTAITPTTSSPTNANSVSFDVTFRKPVVNFDHLNDLVIGGTGTSVTGANFSGGGDSYSVTLTGVSGDGDLTLAVDPASDVEDLDGLSLALSVTSTPVVIDNTAPDYTITASTSGPSNLTSQTFLISFPSEPVLGADADEFLVSFPGGTFSSKSLTPAGGNDYLLTVDGLSGDAELTVSAAFPNLITDLAGNPLADLGHQDSTLVDTVTPTPTITPITSSPTTGATLSFAVDFDEDVTSIDAADFSTSFAATHDTPVLSGSGNSYTLTIENVSGNGPFTIGFDPANDIADTTGNLLGSSGESGTIEVLNGPLTASLVPGVTGSTNDSSVPFHLHFNKEVFNLDLTDFELTLDGAPAAFPIILGAALPAPGGGVDVPITVNSVVGNGRLTLGIADTHDIEDILSQSFDGSEVSASVVVDQTAPTLLSISPITLSPTTSSTIVFELIFDEPMQQIFEADLIITHSGTSHALASISSDPVAQTTTVTLFGVNDSGTVTVAVNPSAVSDLAGNVLLSSPTSDPVERVEPWDYDDWTLAHGLTPGLNDDPGDDPDMDGMTNGEEFAFDGHPNSAASSGKDRVAIATLSGTPGQGLTYTFPVRIGVEFSHDPLTEGQAGNIDNVFYQVTGSLDLSVFNHNVSVLEDALSDGLPVPNPGWEYRSFLLDQALGLGPRGFLQRHASYVAPPFD